MALTSGFFNSVSGDRLYNADQMSEYFDGILTSGVYPNVGNALAVTALTGMTVTVGTGRALINSRWMYNDTPYTLTLNAASPTLNRIDAIVVRYDESARSITLAVKTGTATSAPVAPTMTRTSAVKEYALAYVEVNALTTTITSSMITDKRADAAVCGWVSLALGGGARTLVKTESKYNTTESTTQLVITNSNYSNNASIIIEYDAEIKIEGTDYTVSNGVITFSSPVPEGHHITVVCLSII